MNNDFTLKFDKIVLYSVIYTVCFFVLYLSLPYILPFVLGTLIALIIQPVINYTGRKIGLRRGISSIVLVLLIFAAIASLIVFIIISIVDELISLSSLMPGLISVLKENGNKYLDTVTSYYKTVDPTIIDSIKGTTNQIFSGSFSIAVSIVNFFLDILRFLPELLLVILFTFLTSIYVSIDLPRIKDGILSFFNKEDVLTFRGVIYQANSMISNYLKAYLILILVTFAQTFIGVSILKIRYAIVISLITAIFDLLPILGPGAVLMPIGVGFIITADYLRGFGILILYIVITVVRQILEPKIVSSSLGVHPLPIIIAIFIGLKAYGFVGMIFSVFLVVFYVILKKVSVL